MAGLIINDSILINSAVGAAQTYTTASGQVASVLDGVNFDVKTAGIVAPGDTAVINGATYTVSKSGYTETLISTSSGSAAYVENGLIELMSADRTSVITLIQPNDKSGDILDITSVEVRTTPTDRDTYDPSSTNVNNDNVTLAGASDGGGGTTTGTAIHDVVLTSGPLVSGATYSAADGGLASTNDDVVINFARAESTQVSTSDTLTIGSVTYDIVSISAPGATFTDDEHPTGGGVKAYALELQDPSGKLIAAIIPIEGSSASSTHTNITSIELPTFTPNTAGTLNIAEVDGNETVTLNSGGTTTGETVFDLIAVNGTIAAGQPLTANKELTSVEDVTLTTQAGAGEFAKGDAFEIGGVTYTVTKFNETKTDVDADVDSASQSFQIVTTTYGKGLTQEFLLPVDGFDYTNITSLTPTAIGAEVGAVKLANFDANDNVTLGSGVPATAQIFDAIQITDQVTTTGTLNTTKGLVEVDDPVTFNLSEVSKFSLGDTVVDGGVTYTVDNINLVEANVTSDEGITTVKMMQVNLGDGGTGSLDYLVPVDGANLTNITQVEVVTVRTDAVSVDGHNTMKNFAANDTVTLDASLPDVPLSDFILMSTGVPATGETLTSDKNFDSVIDNVVLSPNNADLITPGDKITINGAEYSISSIHTTTADIDADLNSTSVPVQFITVTNGKETLTFAAPLDGFPMENIVSMKLGTVSPAKATKSSDVDGNDSVSLKMAGTPDGKVDGEEFGENMSVGYDDSATTSPSGTPIHDGGGDLITAGDDLIYGNGGDDVINSGAGNDVIFGGTGNDTLNGGDGSDIVYGDSGDDFFEAFNGANTLFGGIGNDTVKVNGEGSATGGDDQDQFYGFELAPGTTYTVDGSSGGVDNDTMDLPAGAVISSFNVDDDGAGAGTGNGYDGVATLANGATVNFTNIENITIGGAAWTPPAGPDGVVDGENVGETMTLGYNDADPNNGGGGANATDGGGDLITNGNDVIKGNGGDDLIQGANGDDTIFGGTGNDTLFPNAGVGTVFGDSGDDTIGLSGAMSTGTKVTGGETGETTIGDTLSASSAVNVTFTGNEAGTAVINGQTATFSEIENIAGSNQADVLDASNSTVSQDLIGNGGDDTITSGSGGDELYGGAGNDTLNAQAGDLVVGGSDSVSANDQDTLNIDSSAHGGSASVSSFAVDSDGNGYSGQITFADGSTTKFENIENINLDGVAWAPPATTINLHDGIILNNGLPAANDSLTNGGTPATGDLNVVQDSMTVTLDSGGNIAPGVSIVTIGLVDYNVVSLHKTNVDITQNTGPVTLNVGLPTVVLQEVGNPSNEVVMMIPSDGQAFPEITQIDVNGIGGAGSISAPGTSFDDNDNVEIFYTGPDEIVEGTGGDDVIDFNYVDATDGDQLDDIDNSNPSTTTDDVIYGYGGNDTIEFSAGNDTAYGGDGDDKIVSIKVDTGVVTNQTGDDISYGGAGNDTFVAGTNDLVYGGAEASGVTTKDTLEVFDVQKIANLVADGDPTGPGMTQGYNGTVVFNDGTTMNFENIECLVIDGVPVPWPNYIVEDQIGNFDTVIDGSYTGDPEGDMIDDEDNAACDNDDVVQAYGGNDTVLSGDGNDTVFAGTGNDIVFAGAGNDTVEGAAGDDQMEGGAGDDMLVGGSGNDTQEGGTGNDTIKGDDGNDIMFGNEGNDDIWGGTGDDFGYGGTGDDQIELGDGTDYGYGGEGNDNIQGNAGNDFIFGDEPDGVCFTPGGTQGAGTGSASAAGAGVPATDFTFEMQFSGDPLAPVGPVPGVDGDSAPMTPNDPPVGAADTTTLMSYGTAGVPGALVVYATSDVEYFNFPQPNTMGPGGSNDASTSIDPGQLIVEYYDAAGNIQVLETGIDPDTFLDGFDHALSMSFTANEASIYLDGASPATVVTGTANIAIPPGGTITFGDGPNTGGFVGEVNDIRLWDDIRTPAEIAQFHNIDLDDEAGDPNLVSNWTPDPFTGGFQDAVGGNDAAPFGDTEFKATGNQGDDTLFGGTGDDVVIGAGGNDTVDGDAGNDTLYGGAGNDKVIGDEGNDTMYAGSGDDDIFAGSGDDTIYAGTGADSVFGDTGNDYIYAGPGDEVFGGGNGELPANDCDTLDLSLLTPAGTTAVFSNLVSDTTTGGNGNGWNGKVSFVDDTTGAIVGEMKFQDIEKGIPCFTPGTMIKTKTGEVAVEELKVGDKVLTRDNGYQTIRWTGTRAVSAGELQAVPDLQPIRITAGALGDNLPERDMNVSPQHRMLVGNAATELWFGEDEVLVAAKHLTCLEGVDVDTQADVTYVHVMFDAHEIICADGSWSESFQPGDLSLGSLDAAARAELFTLFPELATGDAELKYPAARTTLKAHEAPLVLAAE